MTCSRLAAVLGIALLVAGCRQPGEDVPTPPLEPSDATSTFEIADGFSIEPFAAEPLVTDPVAMEIDEQGRLFVVEMPGYPLDTGGSGRIKLLADTTGDGYPDEASVFADGLLLPTGIMRWKNGVLVTDAPHLYYLEDTTGDGKADVREILLTGFALSNPQHNVNKPLYGLDNWIYLAKGRTTSTETYADKFGDRGEKIRFPNHPDAPVLPRNANGRRVRLKPDTYELEMLSGWSQFGQDFDAWGRHFLVSNAHHHFHEAISARYLERNRSLPAHEAIHHTPVHGSAAEVFPITRNPEHQLLTDVGVMTSACGITYYLGGAFGPDFDNVTFVAEPVHNLVHADRVIEKGSAFEARRLIEDREFLASTDAWFRPVNFFVGPDGALYVIDYYRQIIEHPQWMDDEAVETLDLSAGRDRGRIYRITRRGAPRPTWLGRAPLGQASTSELVAALERDNIWWRRHAQRLLVDRGDGRAEEPLRRLAAESRVAEARVHALWTLQGLGALDADLVRRALADEEPGIRENAIMLAELHVAREPALVEALLRLEHDESARVRYQLLLTLGSFDGAAAREVRDRLLVRDIEDPWVQLAALSAASAHGASLFRRAVAELADAETPGRARYFRHLGAMVAAEGDTAGMRELVSRAASDASSDSGPEATWWQAAALEGLGDQLRASEATPGGLAAERGRLVTAFFASDSPARRRAVVRVLEAIGLPDSASVQAARERAAAIAANGHADEALRTDAIRLLGLSDVAAYDAMLRARIDPAEPGSVQRAAIQVLGRRPGLDVGRFLLARWAEMTPDVRDAAVNVLMTERDRVNLLLDAVEDGQVLVSTIGWTRRVILMRDWRGDVRDRARALLVEEPAGRRDVVERYQAALDMPGDADRGRTLFATTCAPCHQIRGEGGVAFGPDLGTVRHWTPQALVAKILDPNRAIANGYELWVVNRRSGGSVSGVIAAETPQSVTLRNAGGVETTVSRADIASITATNVSAMPSGMEQQIDQRGMADLVAFIRRGLP